MSSETSATLPDATEGAPTVKSVTSLPLNSCVPVRSDWKTMDKKSEEYHSYYVQRHREVCRYRLNCGRTDTGSSSHEPFVLWHSLDHERQEKVLDCALTCINMRKIETENLENFVSMDARPLMGALAALYDIIDRGKFKPRPQKKAKPSRKGSNNLLKTAITNNRLRT